MPARVRIAQGASRPLHARSLERVGKAAEQPTPRRRAPAPAAGAAAAAPRRAGRLPRRVAAADRILGDIGLKQSIALVVPGMMAELETNVTRTRPEIRDSLRATLKAIQPEFDQTAKQTYDQAATLLASQMSEKEITEVAAFFDSPAGKKYVAGHPGLSSEALRRHRRLARKAVDRHPCARPRRR